MKLCRRCDKQEIIHQLVIMGYRSSNIVPTCGGCEKEYERFLKAYTPARHYLYNDKDLANILKL